MSDKQPEEGMLPQLKACPFCGSRIKHQDTGYGGGDIWVHEPDGKCFFGPMRLYSAQEFEEWNTRAAIQPNTDAIIELIAAMADAEADAEHAEHEHAAGARNALYAFAEKVRALKSGASQ